MGGRGGGPAGSREVHKNGWLKRMPTQERRLSVMAPFGKVSAPLTLVLASLSLPSADGTDVNPSFPSFLSLFLFCHFYYHRALSLAGLTKPFNPLPLPVSPSPQHCLPQFIISFLAINAFSAPCRSLSPFVLPTGRSRGPCHLVLPESFPEPQELTYRYTVSFLFNQEAYFIC